MIGTIDVTDANQSVTIEDELDELKSTMQEVRTHIQTARTLVQSAIRDIDEGQLISAMSALLIASSHHWFALSAWEDEREGQRPPGIIYESDYQPTSTDDDTPF